MKLKTLKDINNEDDYSDGTCGCYQGLIIKEAKKHFNKQTSRGLQIHNQIKKEGYQIYTAKVLELMKEASECEAVARWIMKFFNLEETNDKRE